MWSLHTVENDTALKRKEILTDAIKRVDLEDIIPSEINQFKKTNTT